MRFPIEKDTKPTSDLPVPVEPTTAISGARRVTFILVDMLQKHRDVRLSIKELPIAEKQPALVLEEKVMNNHIVDC